MSLHLACDAGLSAGVNLPDMLVIEMHETPERDEPLFRQQLEWAARHFTLVDLPTFARLWQEYRTNPRELTKSKPPLLFTFDDGRLNNYTVAAPILESFGTRGVFFVVPQFVQCNPQEARQFYYSRIDTRQLPPSLLGRRNALHDAPANRGSIAPRALRRQPYVLARESRNLARKSIAS